MRRHVVSISPAIAAGHAIASIGQRPGPQRAAVFESHFAAGLNGVSRRSEPSAFFRTTPGPVVAAYADDVGIVPDSSAQMQFESKFESSIVRGLIDP